MDKENITLAHGNGGQMMQRLINELIIKNFDNEILSRLDDGAVLDIDRKDCRIVFTTDSFVVSPIFFSGGDIGKIAVCGTINDLSMMGAKPLYLSAGVIIEEGFALSDLKKIVASMKKTIDEAQVKIVCGDTKVVNRGSCDKIFINTAGIGIVPKKVDISSKNAKPGDAVIVSGNIGEHGVAIMSEREGLKFEKPLKSDCAPLNGLVQDMLKYAADIHVMRDPTRGGVGTALNEVAEHSGVGIEIDEEAVPVSPAAQGACEILGLDPIYMACEGRLLAFVKADKAEKILALMRANKYGKNSRIIGRVVKGNKKQVYLNTLAGSQRILDVPIADQMPRIC